MQLKALYIAAVAATASAQTMDLTAALQSQPSLSNLYAYLGAFSQFLSQLPAQQNITFLAPSKAAFTKLQSQRHHGLCAQQCCFRCHWFRTAELFQFDPRETNQEITKSG